MAYPPKFKSPEEMQEKIDAYFKDCEGQLLTDDKGKYVMDKFGRPIIIGQKPLTITGLALALGFTNRVSLLNYQKKGSYRAIIETAKLKIENYAEMRLYDKDGSNGARFNLQCNFRDWNGDKGQDDKKGPAINIICDIPRENVTVSPQGQDGIDPQSVNDYLKALEGGKTDNE